MTALRIVVSILVLACGVATAAAQQRAPVASVHDEALIVPMPPGFKLGFQNKQPAVWMMEYVPAAETVKNWTEMVTTQTYFGAPHLTPIPFRTVMADTWRKSCPGSAFQPVSDGTERGYAFAFFFGNCPRSPMTGKQEFTYFKAMRGLVAFYVVQRAFTFTPSRAQIEGASRFMAQVTLCDDKVPARPCPANMPRIKQ